MDAGKRSRLIRRLAARDDGERGLLSNARCLAEGVDVPTLDGVAFIDPRRSEVDIVQAVGRAIRKADNKKIGTVVIPVFIDTDANPEVALSSSVFKPVWDVIHRRSQSGPARHPFRHLAGSTCGNGHRRDTPGADRQSSTRTVASVRTTANEASAMRHAPVPPWKVSR
jgi:predicted helicase